MQAHRIVTTIQSLPWWATVVALTVAGCKNCTGAQTDADLLPELETALGIVDQPDTLALALRRFEKDARIYRRPELANRISRLADQTEAASQPESLCSPLQVSQWIRAHLTRLRAELEKQPTTPVDPILCGSAPRPLVRGVETTWTLYGLDLNSDAADLALMRVGRSAAANVTSHLNVQSAVKAQVRLAGPNALTIGPDDVELVLTSAGKNLSRVPIVDVRPGLRVQASKGRSAVAPNPTATATVPDDHILIGGGCRASFTSNGQLIVANHPSSDRAWTCAAKGHVDTTPGAMAAFALSIPSSLGIKPQVAVDTREGGAQVRALANLPAGYILLGGGCRLKRASEKSTHLITAMKPGTRSYECEAKDHRPRARVDRSQATLEAYAIGIPEDAPLAIVREEVDGIEAGRGQVSARLTDPRAIVVGGGCTVSATEKGTALWASYPRVGERRWVCAHKEHRKKEQALPTAFVLGLRVSEN